MKFFDYCATQYASINLEMQLTPDKFDLKMQAQTKAAHELIDAQRKFYKLTAKVYFIFNFLYCAATGNWPKMPELPKKEEPVAPPLKVVSDDGQGN